MVRGMMPDGSGDLRELPSRRNEAPAQNEKETQAGEDAFCRAVVAGPSTRWRGDHVSGRPSGHEWCKQGGIVRQIHAAPRALATSGEGKRYTFLVNVWLGHRPSGIRPFPAAALDKLTRDGASMRFGAPKTPTPDECSRLATLSFPLARSGTRHVVRMRSPMSGHDFVDLGSSAVAHVEVRVDETPAADGATRAAAGGGRFVDADLYVSHG